MAAHRNVNTNTNTNTLLDTVLIGLGAALASWALLTTSLIAIFVGDLGYALNTAGLTWLPPSMLDAPFRIGYGALGAAALHPSMIRLDAPQPRLSYRGQRRLPGILVTMVVGAVVLAAEPAGNTTNTTVRAVLFGELLLGVLLRSERAVSGFAASEHAARYQSTHDPLTGLPNRALLHARATEQLDASSGPARPSVLFIDLDGFKFVNDSYGHNVGDELLIATAEGLANRIVTVFSEPFALSVGRVYVSASIGIARSDTSSQASDIESLIREADAAMYHAKAHGRGGYAFFDDSLRAQARIQMGVAHRVRTVLAETGLPGHALWFELTETAFVDDTEAALRALQALRTLGSMICVDDFGTGYSVLGYMHRFPISVVKIDGTFVRALDEQQPESSIVSAIRQMSTALGMVTIAEGVETELQETQLRALGCDMAQGYRYGHPLPARSIPSPTPRPATSPHHAGGAAPPVGSSGSSPDAAPVEQVE